MSVKRIASGPARAGCPDQLPEMLLPAQQTDAGADGLFVLRAPRPRPVQQDKFDANEQCKTSLQPLCSTKKASSHANRRATL